MENIAGIKTEDGIKSEGATIKSEYSGIFSAVYLSDEEREMYPEATAVLETLANHLKKNQFVSQGLLTDYNQLKNNAKYMIEQRQVHLYFNNTIYQVLEEDKLNGFKYFSKDFVEELQRQIIVLRAKERGFVEMRGFLTGCDLLTSTVSVSAEQRSLLMSLVEKKLHEKAKAVGPQLELQKKIEDTNNECQALQEAIQNKMCLGEKIMDVAESQQIKLMDATTKRKENLDIQSQILKTKLEIVALKTKLATLDVMKTKFGKIDQDALKLLKANKQKEYDTLKAENEQMRSTLAAYEALPKDQFQPILQQYQKVIKDIENAEWSLQKMQEE